MHTQCQNERRSSRRLLLDLMHQSVKDFSPSQARLATLVAEKEKQVCPTQKSPILEVQDFDLGG